MEGGHNLLAVDAHAFVAPALECMYDRSSEVLRSHWRGIEEHAVLTTPTPGVGDWPSSYLRLGDGDGTAVPSDPSRAPFPPHGQPSALAIAPGVLHDNPAGRLQAMDALGIAAQVVSPALRLDVDFMGSALSRTLFDAYNIYAAAYCAAAPERLKAVLQLHGEEPYWSEEQLDAAAEHRTAAAVTVHLPPKIVPDSPYFSPIWRALERSGLPLVHRPGTGSPWWTPPRFLSYLANAELFDAYPTVRLLIAGWPGGWLADWCEQHATTFARHLANGHVLVAIDRHERAEDVERVIAVAGEDCLVWQSHFPFGDPGAPDERLAFLSESTRRKLLADNAAGIGLGPDVTNIDNAATVASQEVDPSHT